MSSKTILVTGFQPFGGFDTNPALEAVKRLPAQVGEFDVVTVEVPVVYGQALDVIWRAVEEHDPCAVLMVGQARGRCGITVERFGVNLDDTKAPDNAGEVRRGMVIRAGAPAAWRSTLPVDEILANVRACGIPASASDTAGTYLCNHVLFGVLDRCAQLRPGVVAGFVHVPLMHEQVISDELWDVPSLSLADIVAGLSAIVETIAAVQ